MKKGFTWLAWKGRGRAYGKTEVPLWGHGSRGHQKTQSASQEEMDWEQESPSAKEFIVVLKSLGTHDGKRAGRRKCWSLKFIAPAVIMSRLEG